MSVPLSKRPFLYDIMIMSGSLKISFNSAYLCMKGGFPQDFKLLLVTVFCLDADCVNFPFKSC